MRFEPTRDWELVKRIATHPKTYAAAADDHSTAIDQWEPNKSEHILYVLAFDGDELLGMWVLVALSHICWQIHTCLLPNAYGERARVASRELAEWIWENTHCDRLVTEVPQYNRLALRFARVSGMTEYGINPKAVRRMGKLHDVVLLGMSRPGDN